MSTPQSNVTVHGGRRVGMGGDAGVCRRVSTDLAEGISARAWRRGEVGPTDSAAGRGTNAGAGPMTHS
jgi:hypothetical protein